MYLEGNDEWNRIHSHDLWVYNKLILSRVLGYTCGPVGTTVPRPDFYLVRPSMNLLGMGRFARKEYIYKYTDHYHPSEFWCEVFEGDHISIDYQNKEQKLSIIGIRDDDNPLYKWDMWKKVDIKIEYPKVLEDLKGDYEWINCEFIGNKLIEVHFRRNPDFRYGNTVAIPVWRGQMMKMEEDYEYIEDSDYLRDGFWVK
jgi:hypothetical protein